MALDLSAVRAWLVDHRLTQVKAGEQVDNSEVDEIVVVRKTFAKPSLVHTLIVVNDSGRTRSYRIDTKEAGGSWSPQSTTKIGAREIVDLEPQIALEADEKIRLVTLPQEGATGTSSGTVQFISIPEDR